MPFLYCPSCRHRYSIGPDLLGRKVRCGRCHASFVVPAPGAPAALAPPGPSLGRGTDIATLEDTEPQLGYGDEDVLVAAPTTRPSCGPLSGKGYQVRPLASITLGDFQILRKLGSGNMGAVYLAQQRSRNRPVALKVLFKHLALQPLFVGRFMQEALALCRLSHPGIVQLYGVSQTQGFHCLAMEYVNGFTSGFIQARLGGKMALGTALHVTLRIAEALLHAHEHNVVHRDVKPSNILLSDLGRVKLTDLGLAKPLDEDLELTDTGLGLGTPRYMAPEQYLNAKAVDPRADIYALGTCLYEFVTGRLPFEGESGRELLRAKERGYFLPARRHNPEVPVRLDLLLDKMLARDLRYRYPSCRELIRDITSLGLARESIGFNVLQVAGVLCPQGSIPAVRDRVEVLLIRDEHTDVELVQRALQQTAAPSNLTVVYAGTELLRYLGRQEPFTRAPRPNRIVLSYGLAHAREGEVVRRLQADPALATVPLILLGGAQEKAVDVLETLGELRGPVHLCDQAKPDHLQKALEAIPR